MAESDYRKYWYIKLPKEFFNRHDIKILESQKNGKDYCLFYLKLLLESITHNGELRFNETIPYDEEMLSVVTNTNIDTVRTAMNVLTQLGLVKILDDQTIFMTEVNKMIGMETGSAIRKREYREKVKGDNVPQVSHTCPQEKELEKEQEKELESELDSNVKENTKESGLDLDFIFEHLDTSDETDTETDDSPIANHIEISQFIERNNLIHLNPFRYHTIINEKRIKDWQRFLVEEERTKWN